MCQQIDELELESSALSEDRARDFDEWVARRLSEWPAADIRMLDAWLLEESHFEFVPAVRAAWRARVSRRPDQEPAA
jgi:hypothetical protein